MPEVIISDLDIITKGLVLTSTTDNRPQKCIKDLGLKLFKSDITDNQESNYGLKTAFFDGPLAAALVSFFLG